MIPDTTNATEFYITREPDWGQPYSFDCEHTTILTKSKRSAEQRARMRAKPRYSLQYQITGLDRAEYTVRKAEAIQSLGGIIAVPIWHARETFSSLAGNVILLSGVTALGLRPFKAGGLAYVAPGPNDPGSTDAVFVRITSVGNSDLTINVVPEEGAAVFPTFNTGAFVYPVIEGIADENTMRFIPVELGKTTQMFDVMEL